MPKDKKDDKKTSREAGTLKDDLKKRKLDGKKETAATLSPNQSPPPGDTPPEQLNFDDQTLEILQKKYLRLHEEKLDLLEKLEARDEELKQLRDQKDSNVTRSLRLSADGILSPDDSNAEVVRLREVIKRKENKIANLEAQLRVFQDVATERKRFQDHSQDQSRIVMELRQQLEQAQAEISSSRDKLTQKKQVLEEMTKENIVLQERFKEVSDKYNDLQLKYHDMVDQMTSKSEALKHQVTDLKAKIAQNAEELEANKQQAEEYKEEMEEREQKLQMDLRKANSELKKTTAYKERIEKELMMLKQESFQTSQENEELQQKLIKFSREIEVDHKRELCQLKSENANLKQQLVMFKRNDQLESSLRHHHGNSPPPPPKVTRYSPRSVSYKRATNRKKQAAPISTCGPEFDSQINSSISHESTTEMGQPVAPSLTLQYEQSLLELEKRSTTLESEKKAMTKQLIDVIKQMENQISSLESEKQSATASLQEITAAFEVEKKDKSILQDSFDKMLGQSEKMYKQSHSAVKHLQEQVKWLNKMVLKLCPPLQKVKSSHDKLQPFMIHEPFELGSVIGRGCYGAVYCSTIDDDITCIAKRIHDIFIGRSGEQGVSDEEKQSILSKFQRECTILSTARHPNVVQFMGIHYNHGDQSDLCLIMEHLPTDLKEFLAHCTEIKHQFELPLSFQVSILSDIASGLLYLHSQSIVHRDLNAGNVLLTADLQAKIADLGVSKLHQDRKWFQNLTKAPGAQGYMPPEALLPNPRYDEKIDTFSFGVLSLYIALQTFPEASLEHVPDVIHNRGEGEVFKRQIWLEMLETQCHPFHDLVQQCLLVKEKRPDTTRVVEIVQGMHGAHVCTIEGTLNMFAHFHDLLSTKQ